MIRTIIFGTFFFLTLAPLVSANTTVEVSNNSENSKSNVSVKSNTGSNTVCVNGKCTTSANEGESKSTVCVNGDCYETNEKDVNVKSENGKTTVMINNATITSSDSSKEKMSSKAGHKKFFEKKVEVKEKMKEKNHDWVEFIKSHTTEMFKRIFFLSVF